MRMSRRRTMGNIAFRSVGSIIEGCDGGSRLRRRAAWTHCSARVVIIDQVVSSGTVVLARNPDLVHFALAVGGFAIGTTEFATMSLLPYFARDLHVDEPSAGHVISAYALGVVGGAPLI